MTSASQRESRHHGSPGMDALSSGGSAVLGGLARKVARQLTRISHCVLAYAEAEIIEFLLCTTLSSVVAEHRDVFEWILVDDLQESRDTGDVCLPACFGGASGLADSLLGGNSVGGNVNTLHGVQIVG